MNEKLFKIFVDGVYCYGLLPYAPAQWRLIERLHKWEPSPPSRHVVRRNGCSWSIDLSYGHIDREIFYKGRFESETTLWLQSHVKRGWCCLDVGANIGYYTVLLSSLAGDTGRVIAFEPSIRFWPRLTENLRLNAVSNVTAEKVALSNDRSVKTVHASKTTASLFRRKNVEEVGALEDIACTPLDDYLVTHPLPGLDFIKLDIDGFEPFFIEGALKTLSRYRPLIVMEVHPRILREGGGDAITMMTRLADLGYAFHSMDGAASYADAGAVFKALDPTGHGGVNLVCRPQSGSQS